MASLADGLNEARAEARAEARDAPIVASASSSGLEASSSNVLHPPDNYVSYEELRTLGLTGKRGPAPNRTVMLIANEIANAKISGPTVRTDSVREIARRHGLDANSGGFRMRANAIAEAIVQYRTCLEESALTLEGEILPAAHASNLVPAGATFGRSVGPPQPEPAREKMSSELKFILASIGAGVVGLIIGVIMLTALLPDIFGDKEGIVAAAILLPLAAALVGVLKAPTAPAHLPLPLPSNCTFSLQRVSHCVRCRWACSKTLTPYSSAISGCRPARRSMWSSLC